MNQSFSRRSALKTIAGSTAAVGAALTTPSLGQTAEGNDKLKGNIRHSVCKWCYGSIGLDKLAAKAASLGMESVELLDPPDFPTMRKHGLSCAIVSFPTGTLKDGKTRVGGIGRAFNRLEHHDTLVEIYEKRIKEVANAGLKNLICFSGNRAGMDDETGLKNCATGLKRILSIAEKHKVNIVMELLNSRVNHKDYMCDRTDWGVELCKAIDSERFGLLYDIYHMQIMEGDVIRTIRNNHKYLFHYHTGGNPGRNEIDETQELYYPAIMRAILETGYKGHVGQEFIPKREDKLASLEQGVRICDV
jgi:hydroxypyruvate isomerase